MDEQLSDKLQMCSWVFWGWRLEHDLAAISSRHSTAAPRQLVWRELRGLPSGQVQHGYRGYHVQQVCFVWIRHVLDRPWCLQRYKLHCLPGWHISVCNCSKLLVVLLTMPIWNIFYNVRRQFQLRMCIVYRRKVRDGPGVCRRGELLKMQLRDLFCPAWGGVSSRLQCMLRWTVLDCRCYCVRGMFSGIFFRAWQCGVHTLLSRNVQQPEQERELQRLCRRDVFHRGGERVS